jgi:hypothetical protein
MQKIPFLLLTFSLLTLPARAFAEDTKNFKYFHFGAHSHMTHLGGEVGLGLPGRIYLNAGIFYHMSDIYGDFGPEYPLRNTGYYQSTSDDWIMRTNSMAVSLLAGFDLIKSRGPCSQEANGTCTGIVRLYAGIVKNLKRVEYEPLSSDAEDPDLRLELKYQVIRLGVGVGYSLGVWYIGLNAGIVYTIDGIAAEGGSRILPALDFSMGFLF